MSEYFIDGHRVMQIQLPDEDDTDEHPRIRLNGDGIHAGEVVQAWIPGKGLVHLRLEVSWEAVGASSWYVANEEYRDVCPIGLWCVIS